MSDVLPFQFTPVGEAADAELQMWMDHAIAWDRAHVRRVWLSRSAYASYTRAWRWAEYKATHRWPTSPTPTRLIGITILPRADV